MASRAAVAVISALVFTAALLGAGSRPSGWETSVARSLVGMPDAIEPLLWVAMQAGTRGALLIAVASCLLARRVRAAAVVGIGGGAGWALAVASKEVVERGRPAAALLGRPLRDHVEGYGFPSSHAAIGVAIAAAVVLAARPARWLSIGVAGLAVSVAIARVYFGVHWPLDLVGGAALGAFTAAITAAVLR